jgi:hypothetical protein
MDDKPHQYDISVLDNDAVEIDMSKPLVLQAEEVQGVSVRLRIPKSEGQGVQALVIEIQAQDDPSIKTQIKAKALMPLNFGSQP